MSTLSQAPLVEAILELRWGDFEKLPDGTRQFVVPAEERDLFFGLFNSEAGKAGFQHRERANPEPVSKVPHVAAFRYREKPNGWPCYQVGIGLFTANQVNDGYDWPLFRDAIAKGVGILDRAHPANIGGLPSLQAILRYKDAFLFDEEESANEFLQNKMRLGLSLADDFTNSAGVSGPIRDIKMEFRLACSKPEGFLIISLIEALINGKPGFVMDTVVESRLEDLSGDPVDALTEWAESAHLLQQHAFKTLINPAYKRSMK